MEHQLDIPNKIAILGDGVTGKAVLAALDYFNIPPTHPSTATWIVASPGIPPEQYPKVDGEILSEIEFAYRLFHKKPSPPPQLIGITGTNGKSTVTAMLAHCLDCPAAGNFGVPLVTFTHHHPTPDVIAVELSSYQLETCTTFHPQIAILLNLSPDHLERHKTMAAYLNAKAKLFQNLNTQDTLILGDDPRLVEVAKNCPAKKLILSKTHADWQKVKLPNLVGEHNYENALAALWAAKALGHDEKILLHKLATFKGLAHRIEHVGTWEGLSFYNDSKGTNPDSTLIAIQAFPTPTHLILGGKDKGLELDDFLKTVLTSSKSLTVYGEIAPRLLHALEKIDPTPYIPISQHNTLEEALAQSIANAKHNDIILFSPGCSSFDQFKNFEDRGEKFKSMVKKRYGQTQ